ncbi:hypothetical protein [Ramlibacter sp.]|uniref:hypothetical protein n=1 Tax=Ramlibacter sp. TaxID=1917967 RepID=UPI002B732012|nr:hypothetical protein [Ramlibacter sp.]HWI81566.1 hypothetical protein [Ramlibacter sp.]
MKTKGALEKAVVAALERATQDVCEHDWHLLHADASERSLTHRLAVHLAGHFPGYHVDCEYNRDGFDVKRLALHERVGIDDDSLDAVTVFPDVIVHVRGRPDRNLLVVEVKKASSRVSDAYDFLKLQAFKRDLGYAYAAHLRIGFGDEGELVARLQWVSG